MMRLLLALLAISLPSQGRALESPEQSCVSPVGTVTRIDGIDTRHASMDGRYTLPDIEEGCHQGWVDQGGSQPPERCVAIHRSLLSAPVLHASADCVAGLLRFGNQTYHIPVSKNCASGGIYAAKAFRLLCPSYGGSIDAD